VVNNIDDIAFIYKNNTMSDGSGNNFLLIELEGTGNNRMGIGAKVEIWSGGEYQYYEHFLTRGYISSVDPTVHFGLGQQTLIDSLSVTWTSKAVTRKYGIQSNQLIHLMETDAKQVELNKPMSSPLFRKIADVIDYTHSQKDYIDFFQNQNIIPHKFSQIGPSISQGDLNRDGLDDLIIGATNRLPTQVFLNTEDGFISTKFDGLTEEKSCPESDLLILDIDGDHDNDIVVLSGGYSNEDPQDYKHFVYINENGVFTRETLPVPPFPASIVRASDFDKDGDLDLFIGARVSKGNFPLTEHSFILKNDQGSFTQDQSFDLGMVTDALWTDYDGDGWEDLMITREWNSIAVLKNQEGQQFEIQVIPDFQMMTGSWSSIQAGDFDMDGDDDLILGNLGENHRFNISKKYPMKLYAIDLDQNGSIDPLTTAFWPNSYGKMEEYPINYLDELAAQSPYFRKIFTSYKQFSYATVGNIIDLENIPVESIYTINTTSSYVLWNDQGTFRWEVLPKETQVSPIREMLVHDFNGDSFPDVLLGGNDYTYDVSTGYYDANKGIILLSNGKSGGFSVLTSSASGLNINGQVESLHYIGGSPPLVIVGINREKIDVFEHRKQ